MKIAAIFFALILAHTGTAHAGQAEVRDVALNNNCTPKKIEIYKASMGANSTTTYRVQCTMPKTVGGTDGSTKPPDALLISCDMNLCAALQAVALEKK